jgi:hypothetical protein
MPALYLDQPRLRIGNNRNIQRESARFVASEAHVCHLKLRRLDCGEPKASLPGLIGNTDTARTCKPPAFGKRTSDLVIGSPYHTDANQSPFPLR